ncbi:MAG: hypothetical protein A2339_04005 [Elusimicrobia bacterium RIFOXYB12_FULL_50_12]|nr:MAG: hypothetical protein A2278_05475 [Elusimicrobia bacterium RIFOXYA12_FULL_49_49]OGS16583.1 MAG: hypothetical protein A2251_02960 [Elusimicrobia bacterium RIFOXYA2_FULL_47_53]OGS26751.1 MAG: hypothetical protein A2339_04005 [Elusimicrobia bacterium RIFOXYB12_FULL_50_12]OGS31559.1 MAG: hypothetical protein A2323_05585 [Elusimicrobia bacterium RIFOXYB2_FULL_46_23]
MINASREHIKLIRDTIKQRFAGAEVRVFGSRVNGKSKKYSDIDLAIVEKRKISLKHLNELRDAFQESDIPYRVDIQDWRRVSREFKAVINKKYAILK